MKTLIETQKLGCKSGARFLLQDVDWVIEQGDHWVVFGMNGCGKTTLLSIMAGWKAHTHGTLKVFGQPYDNDTILQKRRRIGWVSSSFFDQQLSKESALDIVLSGKFGTLSNRFTIQNKDIIQAKCLLEELHMGHRQNGAFDKMSKGERQNILIARALMANPEILILDEPGTGLDVYAREHMLSTVKDLADHTDMTIIYVTHYVEEILPEFEHCVLMKSGRIYKQGLTRDVFNNQTISALLNHPVDIRDGGERKMLSMAVPSQIEYLLKGH